MNFRKRLYISFITFGIMASANSQNVKADSINTDDTNNNRKIELLEKYSGMSVSTVKGDALSKSFITNIANTLNGRITGLVVEAGGGEAGADAPVFNARGINTFSSGSNIYILIDGLPSNMRFLQQLTPQEIESIQLLKDAASTAIYGGRAANGVLLVKTKRGSISPLKLELKVQQGNQFATRLPQFLDAYDYARLYNEALLNDGENARYTDADLALYKSGNDPVYHPNVNWYNQVLQNNAPVSDINLTAQGGNETIKYFALLNVLNSEGLYKRTSKASEFTKDQKYSRYNFRTNVDVKLSKYLSAKITLGGTVEDKTNPGVDENANNIFNLMALLAPNAFPVDAAPNRPGGSAMFSNPWHDIAQRGYVSYSGRAAQIMAKFTQGLDVFVPGLSVSAQVGFNSYFRSYSIKTRNYARFSTALDTLTGNPVYTQFNQNTSLSGNEGSSYQWRSTAFQGFLDYNKTIGEHEVNAMLSVSYDDYTESNNYGDASINTILPYANIDYSGNVDYTYAKKYCAQFAFGYTGNDNFISGQRFGFFPAGSLAWIISNESFLKEIKPISFLKLKASYGLTGNINIGGSRFMYNQYYDWSGYNFGSDNGARSALIQGVLANPYATWEKERKFNLGFDATLFNHLTLNVEYFKNYRYDILAQPFSTVPDFIGVNMPYMNVGSAENYGFEATVGYENEINKDLKFFVETSVWFARNRIIFNAEAPKMYDYLYQTGQSIDKPFLLEAIGFFKDQAEINNSPKQVFANVQPGDLKYKDQNDDNIINENDYVPSGFSTMPEYSLRLHGGINYKGFDIEFFMNGAFNRSIYLTGSYVQAFQNEGQISTIALGRWTPETAETATYPRLSSKNNLNNYQPSTFWQRNGAFLKLRNVELGYTIPKNLTDKVNITKVRAFVNANNLFSIDHMNGFIDPESISGGVGYPVLSSVNFGINLQL